MNPVYILGIYFFGYAMSLLALKKYGKALGFGDYDPPHDSGYDDYKDNNTAWTAFSIAWPIFWVVILVSLSWKGLVYITSKI